MGKMTRNGKNGKNDDLQDCTRRTVGGGGRPGPAGVYTKVDLFIVKITSIVVLLTKRFDG